MANSTNDNRNPTLLITHDEAKSVLQERIDKGEDLLRRCREIHNEEQQRDLRADYYTWADYNDEFLKRSFSDDSYYREYEATAAGLKHTPPALSDYGDYRLRRDTQSSIYNLESLLERLDLIPSSSASVSGSAATANKPLGSDIFIVHGSDDGAKQAVARLIEQLGLNAVILDEQPQAGQTIIEKFEEHAGKAGFAIVLLTPDDVGAKAGAQDTLAPRARQNVIFELGFFVGKLGRERVCPLYNGVEIPSDYYGVGYIKMDSGGAWRYEIGKELRNAGFPADLNEIP